MGNTQSYPLRIFVTNIKQNLGHADKYGNFTAQYTRVLHIHLLLPAVGFVSLHLMYF